VVESIVTRNYQKQLLLAHQQARQQRRDRFAPFDVIGLTIARATRERSG
jgi:hypothetical protein